MRQFTALFKKEIGAYFKSYFAYFVFFIYLFVSVGGAFYFGEYLAMHDTAVYALFYLQPIVLTLLIPALTMRLWSDEYKSGTAEFLLTQPLSNKLPVLAKFLASGTFAAGMSLFTLPFIIYTANWLKIDFGNVVCCYLGVWLYILLFCSLGCLVSSLNKYTVISYLLTVFISVLWLLMRFTKLYDIYNNFLFAEVGISDFAYFIIFIVVLVCLNVLVLDYNRSSEKNKNLRFFGGAVLFVIGAIILNSAVFLLFDGYKADLTFNRQYTLSPVSREIVASLGKPVTIDVYISKDLKAKNAEYYYYYQQTRRFIEKYRKVSGSMANVNITEVEPFSELEKFVLVSDLYFEENLKGTKDYFGAVIRDNDGQGVVIKQFLPQRRAFLEKDIDKALLKLTRKDVTKSIGIYFDPRQELDIFNGFSLNLEEDYDVVAVTEDTYEISPKLDLLILVNPKELEIGFLYAIDQYIANGGKTLIFVDLLTDGQSEETNLKTPSVVLFMDQMNIMIGEELVDNGSIAENYKTTDKNLNLYKTITYTATDNEWNIRPIIENPKGYIGAVFSGQYKSLFEENPHKSKKVLKNMMPHTFYSSETATVAFIGDADIIENQTWIDDKSPDQNPYSVIFKSANMEVIRSLVDELSGNEIYNKLPQNEKNTSSFGIGELVNAALYNEHYEEYNAISEDMKLNRLKLLQKSEWDAEKMQYLLQTDEAGLQLGRDEQKMEKLFYKMKKQYSLKINTIILLCAFVWPASACLLLWLSVFLWGKRQRRKVKELFYE